MSRIMWVHPDGRRWDRTLPPRKVGTLGDQVRSRYALSLFCLTYARLTRLQPAAVCTLAVARLARPPYLVKLGGIGCRTIPRPDALR